MIVTDLWLVQNEMAEFFPTIALAGAGVSVFTAQIYEDLPIAYTRDAEGGRKRVAVWGTDQDATPEGSQIFIGEGFLDRFLALVWRRGDR